MPHPHVPQLIDRGHQVTALHLSHRDPDQVQGDPLAGERAVDRLVVDLDGAHPAAQARG